MFGKLNEVEKRFEQVQQSLMEPGVANNQERYRSMMKELSDLKEIVDVFRDYKKTKSEIDGNKEILGSENDPDLREMAKEELGDLEKKAGVLEEQLKILLLPKDPNDDKNVIVEILALIQK